MYHTKCMINTILRNANHLLPALICMLVLACSFLFRSRSNMCVLHFGKYIGCLSNRSIQRVRDV